MNLTFPIRLVIVASVWFVPFLHGLSTVPLSMRIEESQRVLQNLLSISTHLQNPSLFTPSWADRAELLSKDNNDHDDDKPSELLVVSSKIHQAGEVLSLFPIHGIGWRASTPGNDWLLTSTTATDSESTVFLEQDLHLHDEHMFPYPAIAPELRHALFIASDTQHQSTHPGWLAHKVLQHINDKKANSTSQIIPNCVTVTLPGACPICALVSIGPIEKGQTLCCMPSEEFPFLDALTDTVHETYCTAIAELQSYLDMAYTSSASNQQTAAQSTNETQLESSSFQTPFHSINLDYPGIRQVHTDPDVYLMDHFLTDTECDLLRDKAEPHLQASLVKNADTGRLEENPSRTNMDCNIPQNEAPSIVAKITNATNCDARQLEMLQVLRYQKGQQFKPHTDGFDGPVSACGFHQSGRLVTFFCYLNDVKEGGYTHFPQLGPLWITPKKGMAVCFFPSTTGLEEDVRTEHEGSVAVDPKWLLVTWVWKNYRSHKLYDESRLEPLDEHVII